ncbi:MAG TPA: hypothetical protein VHU18_03525 [Rhizomicrobium sp.]|jgi:hypothetical protein|nr:hypothetical protein [Rhizomicrobium sp.]
MRVTDKLARETSRLALEHENTQLGPDEAGAALTNVLTVLGLFENWVSSQDIGR